MLIECTPLVPELEPGRTQVPVPPATLISRWKRNSPPLRDGVHCIVPRQVPSGPDFGVAAAALLGAGAVGGATAAFGGGGASPGGGPAPGLFLSPLFPASS